MKRRDSIYQLILSIVYTILGGLCFIPNFNFLQNMIFIIGLLITIIGIVLSMCSNVIAAASSGIFTQPCEPPVRYILPPK